MFRFASGTWQKVAVILILLKEQLLSNFLEKSSTFGQLVADANVGEKFLHKPNHPYAPQKSDGRPLKFLLRFIT